MKEMKRILSFVLCVVMLIGLLPIGVLAEETQPAPITDAADIFSNLNTTGEFSKKEMPQEAAALLAAENEVVDAAVIFTDLHTSSSNYKESTLKGIMTAIKNAGLPVSSVTSGGDAFSVNADSTKYTGKTSTLTGYIQAVLGNIPVNYVWSDHDRYAVEADGSTLLNKKSRLVYGAGADGVYGTGDDGNYYVYALSMGDLCSYDRYTAGFNYSESDYSDRAAMGFTSTVEQAIKNFEADAAKLNKDRPLFIVSHQPLFDNRNDNAFAEDWFDSINEVAEDMDVAFFYGHNHKYDTGSDYYYAKGSSLPVATMDNWGWEYDIGGGPKGYLPSMDLTSESKTLNFTHMCAGYMAPSSTGSTSSTTREGVAVGIAIYDDEINYTTYNASGIYSGNYALNKTVKRDHAAVAEPDPTEPEETLPEETQPANPEVSEPVADSNGTGVTVAASGVTKVEVSVVENPSYDAEAYTAYASFDINVEGHENGVKATVTIPAPAGFDAARPVQVLYEGEVIATTSIVDGKITFTTDHFSVYDVAQTAEGDLEWVQVSTAQDKTIFRLTDSLTSGKKYVIVNRNTAGNGNAITRNSSSSAGSTSVTVIADADGNYIEAPATTAQWEFNSSSKLQSVSNAGNYLFASGNNSFDVDDSSFTNYTTWSYTTSNGLRARKSTTGNTYRNCNNYYIYVEEKLQSDPLWAAMEGQTSFQFGIDEYSEDAIRKAIKVYTATDANGTGKTATTEYTLEGTVNANAVGTYNLTVKYGDETLGTIEVKVQDVSVEILELITATGTVTRGSKATTATGGKIRVTYKNANEELTTEDLDVTLEMLDNDASVAGTYTDLTVSYGGKTVEGFTLIVKNKTVAGNNYPEYPDEGAVYVSKTATGIDFQSTGVAQVEVSASGVPMKRGVDVIIMLDMSSSMDRCINCGQYTGKYSSRGDSCNCSSTNSVSRVDELKTAMQDLKNVLVAAPGSEDIRVAVADFNGRYTSSSSAYQIDTSDCTVDQPCLAGDSYARVLTGSGLNANAFISPSELDIDAYFSTASGDIAHTGTNYDYAFDAIYQLGHAIKQANGEEQRDLYVLFMSDGAPNQFNYYGTTGGSGGTTDWNYWLTGNIGNGAGQQTFAQTVSCSEHTYYYDATNGNQHRMATAIKGDPGQTYEVIRKNQNKNNPTDAVTGLLTAVDGKENMYRIPGLGATMYSVAFYVSNDGNITEASAKHALQKVPSSPELYIEAEEAGALSKAFGDIATDILYAAYNARFVDQMGDNYNLQMGPIKDLAGNAVTGVENKIEIITYDIYTKEEADASTTDGITEDMIGDRKGSKSVLETVTFSADGKAVYSDKNSVGPNGETIPAGQNILIEGVIYAQSFWYNTNPTAVAVAGVAIPTGKDSANLTTGATNMLPSETFYWKMGTVKTSELAMRYYVYLDGSMEGTREGGSYATNEFATLYYDNYLGNPCYKDTVSPVMAWKEANVSYAFYLVDENGKIIVNQTTGETGSFANKIAVTNPVVHETVLLNNEEEVSSIDIASLGVLPEGYTLYDYDGTNGAKYKVTINSNTTGSWEITSVKDPATTYVTQYDPNNASAYSNNKSVSENGLDYTHTIVWFAVVWKVQALPDAVVVDYGLPVDISVLGNDMFGEHGKLAAVGAYSEDLNLDVKSDALADGFGTEYIGTYGTAKANTADGEVRYTLNSMKMDSYEKFAYAVNYTGSENAGYYYDTVTVIPATTIYYEDGFLNFVKYNADGTENGTWDYEGTLKPDAAQDEDRPGKYALTDANNIYGYDSVNNGMTTFSMGQARKVHVDASSYATATFSFAGTGFDVISMTSNTTGAIAVEVKNADGVAVANKLVNTYYGYTLSADGKWVVATGNVEPLYQVPVLQIENLPYGVYDVKITATYVAPLDKTTADGYDLYLDAIRIYDPANDGAADGTDDTTIEDAYKADGEGWPSYIELRNKLIDSKTLGNAQTATEVVGLVFIDGDASVGDAQIGDYQNFGPNNEVYLAPGQRVAFLLNTPANVANVHIGIKSADGKTGTYTITNIAKQNIMDGANVKVEAGSYYNEKSGTISTTTDMYYDMTGWKGDIVVITNTGDGKNTTGVISLTNIKSTYKSDPNETVTTSDDEGIDPLDAEEKSRETYLYMTPAAATLTLRALNRPAEEDVPGETIPEETTPDVTEPEETIPEETVPETTVPEETEPETEATQPDATEPDSSEPELDLKPEVSKVLEYVVQKVTKAVSSLLKKWFR